MKSISKILVVLLAITFASCDTNNMIAVLNPGAEDGTLTFVLNQPQNTNFTLLEENATTTMVTLTASQPDFGFRAAVIYYVEISFNADMSNRVTLGASVRGATVPISVRDMNMGILGLYGGNMPNPVVARDVYVRLRAFVSASRPSPLAPEPTVKPLFSNTIRFNILPYFVD